MIANNGTDLFVNGFIKGIQVICCGCGGSKHIQCPYLNSVAIAAGVFGGGAGERECIRGQTYGAPERLNPLISKLLAGSCANKDEVIESFEKECRSRWSPYH